MQQIGRYIVVREVGRGAMGFVFEARDPLIGRIVAVKTIRLDALGSSAKADQLQERLFREARAAGALSHPGIVVIHDLGRHEGQAYIAMERVDGPTLEQVIATGARLSAAEVLDILRQAAAALDYAHQNGVVHRDIKPGNLMLHKGVTLKITDFGVAKIASMQSLTETGTVLGTPHYMSPEQITAPPVDGRADQFSLAVIAFELLAGRRPFQGATLPKLLRQIVHEERPSVCSSRPDLPAAADAVLKRGLSKDAGDRYPSCAAFVDALEVGLAFSTSPVRADPARPAAAETRCTVCGAVLKEGQFRCGACASTAAAKTSFKEAFAVEQETIDPKQRVAVVAKQPESLAATQTLPWPLPDVLSAAIAEVRASAPPSPLVISFTASPSSIIKGESALLEWAVENATGVRIDPGFGPEPAAGGVRTSPAETATYTLVAVGAGGETRCTVTVEVLAQPSASSQPAARAMGLSR